MALLLEELLNIRLHLFVDQWFVLIKLFDVLLVCMAAPSIPCNCREEGGREGGGGRDEEDREELGNGDSQ